MTTLAQLILQGFNDSRRLPGTVQYHVRCSECTPSVVNGTPIHERGCRNEKVECKGCNTLIAALTARVSPYCENCR